MSRWYLRSPKHGAIVLPLANAGRAIHVVWGIPKGFESPAVLVTAYRSDPARWDERFVVTLPVRC
jgi:hypothetical protein